jgi:hypothetical protein
MSRCVGIHRSFSADPKPDLSPVLTPSGCCTSTREPSSDSERDVAEWPVGPLGPPHYSVSYSGGSSPGIGGIAARGARRAPRGRPCPGARAA